MTNHLASHNSKESSIADSIPSLITTYAAKARSKPKPLELNRGSAATPLRGIDVPFHSTCLRPGIRAFRSALKDVIKVNNVDAHKLINRYIPNLTGKPFQVSKEYFEEVGKLTGSSEIKNVLQQVR